MEEVSPWSRLGFGTTRNVEENKELLLLRDQVIELSKQLADLTLRLERMERVNASEEKPIENVFAVADYSDFFGEETEDSPVVEDDADDEIVRVKTGFVAPPPEEVEEVEAEDIEPVGQSGDIDSEESPIQKEFDEKEEEEIIAGICDMVEQYIEKNHGILNNQLKKKIYSDIPVNDKIKKGIKEALADHPRIKAHKLDKFRTLYHMGEDADEEYAKAFGG
tara:strand:+ start:1994 stop:2656 length:663 start_codon:yes stop_codon:yes gene_type:complete